MHVSLYVSDMAKTLAFYTSFFEQEPEKVKPGYAKYILRQPALIISFVENKDRVQSNFGHMGFQVETLEELNTKLAYAKEKNLVSKEEIGTNCCYATQDKFWANDPDGVQWEVYYFHQDAEFKGMFKKVCQNIFSRPPIQKVNCRPKEAIYFLNRRSRPKAAFFVKSRSI
jgi:catechol 2,3-dioxygenase-like lactoylglutathione lyase family enzyme